MKKICGLSLLCTLFISFSFFEAKGQTSPTVTAALPVTYPWTNDQLIGPSDLAGQIDKGIAPIIFNIGAVEDIKGAKHIGPVSNAANMQKFRAAVVSLPKNTPLVIYCGCCPFTKCPNIKPAFNELKSSGFTNVKVLDLKTNLKTDWIARGYPYVAD